MYRQLFLFLAIPVYLVTANEVNETETVDDIASSTTVLPFETSPAADELVATDNVNATTETTAVQLVEDTSTAAAELVEETSTTAAELVEETSTTAAELVEETSTTAAELVEETSTTAAELVEETSSAAVELIEETTATEKELPQGASTTALLGNLTTATETPSVDNETTTEAIAIEINTTVAATTTSSPGTCVDYVNPLTGRSDCRRRKNLCTRAGFKALMKDMCPVTCGYCKICSDEANRNKRGFCSQPNILRLCEHNNLKVRAATRNRCPVTCGVCVQGTLIRLK